MSNSGKSTLLWMAPVCIVGLINCTIPLAHADHLLELKLDPQPFSLKMCKHMKQDFSIRIGVANRRDIIIRRYPGQYIPQNSMRARQKDYVQFVTLRDITNGTIPFGSIVFNSQHAIIVAKDFPNGLSRKQFTHLVSPQHHVLADKAFNTFLRLHPIFNAAVDACRPAPHWVAYETDDETLRIEMGKQQYLKLVQDYNAHPQPHGPLIRYQSGKVEGFIDPHAGKHTNISYQAMNPLNFYVPTSYP